MFLFPMFLSLFATTANAGVVVDGSAVPACNAGGVTIEGLPPCEEQAVGGVRIDPSTDSTKSTSASSTHTDLEERTEWVRRWSKRRDTAIDHKVDVEIKDRKAADQELEDLISTEAYIRYETDYYTNARIDVTQANQSWLEVHKAYFGFTFNTGPRWQPPLTDDKGLALQSESAWNVGGDFYLAGAVIDKDGEDGEDMMTVMVGPDFLINAVMEARDRCSGDDSFNDNVTGIEFSPAIAVRMDVPGFQFSVRGGYGNHTVEELVTQGFATGVSATWNPIGPFNVGARGDAIFGSATYNGKAFPDGVTNASVGFVTGLTW